MQGLVAELPFDLRALEIFLAVCETGSMASAARQLGITQPAVSLAISEMERKTSSTLFDRSLRPLALTVAGGLLRQRATALLAEAHVIPEMLRETAHGKLPFIRVGMVDSLARALTVPVAQFLKDRAGSVSVLSGLTDDHASALLTRRLDILVGVDDLQETPGLERWEVTTEPYVLLLGGKAKKVRTQAQFEALVKSKPMIRFTRRSQTGAEIDRHLRRLKLTPEQFIECDTPYAVAALVSTGDAFAISTPLCVFEAQLPANKLQVCKLPGPQISRRLLLVARHRELGNLPRLLVQEMKAALEKHQPALRRLM